GADAPPMSNAAQPAQRWPAWHPRAVRAVSAAAASPAVTSPAAGAECRAAARTRPQRVRSRAAAVSSIATIRYRPTWGLAGEVVFPPSASASVALLSQGRQLFIRTP